MNSKGDLENRQTIFDLMGHSFSIQQIDKQIQRVAWTNFTVIVEGETGTGKELVARLLHDHSDRANKPFVAIDCGAIPDSLVESELFGYVKGAFTGAESKKEGYFELTKGGTLFLDEIANLSVTVQMKVLRSLQERRILPLGSEKSVPIDVRIVVASNAILEEEVSAGRFRADLFHRLNEFKIYLLALRDRREDILFLADRFRAETNAELGKHIQDFSAEAQAYLFVHDWPGNVRELRNTVRRAVLLSQEVIELKHLRQHGLRTSESRFEGQNPLFRADQDDHSRGGLHEIVSNSVMHLEKTLIQHAMQQTDGNKSQAAKFLRIGYKTLYRKLKDYGML